MTEQEFKNHVEDISKNNTCHRPDISHYSGCEPCPYVQYCLCTLNTKKFKTKRKRTTWKKVK